MPSMGPRSKKAAAQLLGEPLTFTKSPHRAPDHETPSEGDFCPFFHKAAPLCDEEKQRHFDQISEIEGLDICVEDIEANLGKRSTAKLAINRIWGEYGMRSNLSRIKIIETTPGPNDDIHLWLHEAIEDIHTCIKGDHPRDLDEMGITSRVTNLMTDTGLHALLCDGSQNRLYTAIVSRHTYSERASDIHDIFEMDVLLYSPQNLSI